MAAQWCDSVIGGTSTNLRSRPRTRLDLQWRGSVVARFWFDSLLEEEILKKKYGRLFSISLQHDVVGNIGAWVGNEWV